MKRVRIPKQFRAPRPMSAVTPKPKAWWRRFALEACAVLAGALVAWGSAANPLDEWVVGTGLRLAGKAEPSRVVVALTISGDDIRSNHCAERLASAVANARGVFVLGSVEELCSINTSAGSKIMPLDVRDLYEDASGRVSGFRETGRSLLGLTRLGLPGPGRVAPRQLAAVPVIRLDDISEQRVSERVLSERVVVVGPAAALEPASRLPLVQNVAAALAAGLEDGVRSRASRTAITGVALVLCLLLVLGLQLGQKRPGARLAALAVAGAAVGITLGGILGFSRLLPVGSLIAAMAASLSVLGAPGFIAARRAGAGASKLLEQASTLQTQNLHSLSDGEFWARLARMAEHAHPADAILLAELPPHTWRLEFWPNGELDESAITERRRDIRRRPYSNDQGAPTTAVIKDFLIMKGVPTVSVPLVASGEVEGYLFLFGVSAEGAFHKRPEVTQHLALDLAALIRKRRLIKQQEPSAERASIAPSEQPSRGSVLLLEGARSALNELKLFHRLVQEAPVGLLYADSFGDVRILGKAFTRWLPQLKIAVPPSGQPTIAVGALPLGRVLTGFAAIAGVPEPALVDIKRSADGVRLEIQAPDDEANAQPRGLTLVLRVQALETIKGAGSEDSAGFVGTLTEMSQQSINPTRLGLLPLHKDSISVFSLAQMLTEACTAATQQSGTPVRFEKPRVAASVLGQRKALGEAFMRFLSDAATLSAQGTGPVVTLRERRFRVEVSLLDLNLGVPAAALKRTLLAPTQPPAGLETLGELIRAIEGSHGHASIDSEDGWGIVFVAHFARARPQLEPRRTESGELLALPRTRIEKADKKAP